MAGMPLELPAGGRRPCPYVLPDHAIWDFLAAR